MKLSDNTVSMKNLAGKGESEAGRGAGFAAEAVSKPSAKAARSVSTFRSSSASELQDLDIWRIVACLPQAGFAEIKQKILGLSRDRSFAMNYWVKVCKLRAMKGLPMPWETIH